MNDSTLPMAYPGKDALLARRALAHALSTYLDSDRVHDAVSLWNQTADGQASLLAGLTRYCKQVAELFGLSGREAELHLKILRAMKMDPRLLPDDPLSPRASAAVPIGLNAPESAASATPNSSALLLQKFFGLLEDQFTRESPTGAANLALRRSLVGLAKQLPPAQRIAVVQWCTGETPALQGQWPAGGHGTVLVNLIYVALAELIGPVRADRALGLAVADLEASGDAALKEIRRYL